MNNNKKTTRKLIKMDDNEKVNNSDLNNTINESASKNTILTNDDGSMTYITQTTEIKKGTSFVNDPQKVEEVSLGVSAEDTKYVDAIRAKKELGILREEKLITYITVEAFEKILKFMDESLDNYFDALAFGIYSTQEITELKKSVMTIQPEKENFQKYLEVFMENDNDKIDKFAGLNDDIFLNVDKELKIIKEEEERRKREEEERLRKLKEAEEEKKRMKLLRRKKIKTLFEETINSHEPFEIMKRRFKQYKEGVEEAKKKQKNKEMEEQKKLLRLKKQKEEAQKKMEEDIKKAEEEKRKKEEEERIKKEEAERIKKEEEEKRKKEEEKRKKEEEEERIKKEEEERIKKEEEERIKKEQEEKRKKEEEEKRKKEEEEKRKKEEEESLRKEEERKRNLEEEKKRKEEEERIKREEEERQKKEEEERIRKENEEKIKKEEEERIRRENEEKIKNEEGEKKIILEEKEEPIRLEEEKIKKEKEENIKKEEELRRIKEEEEEEKRKIENDLKKKKELEKEKGQLLKDKINENKENILLSLDDIIKYKSEKEEDKISKKEEVEEKEKKEPEKERISPTSQQRPSNLIVENVENKISSKRQSKVKSQVNIIKNVEKKPEKSVKKRKINSRQYNNKIIESKRLLSNNYPTLAPRTKSTSKRPKKKENFDDLMINNQQFNKIAFGYPPDFETNFLGEDEIINSRMKRNKSTERRPIKNNLVGEQYIKILCNECGEKNDFSNYCENCKGPICVKCRVPHLIENPNHKYNILKNKNYILKIKKCTKCEKNLENLSTSKCLNCPNELFCDECKINHNLIYPEHTIISKPKEKSNNIDSENSDENLDNKNLSNLIKCFLCQNKIKFKDNHYITHCNKCKGNLCNRCENIHLKKNPLHKLISLSTLLITDTSNIENYYNCIKCSMDLNNSLYLYNCPQCKGNLCHNCGNDHHKKFPRHKLSILKANLPELDNINNNLSCYNCGRDSCNYCDKCKLSFCEQCIKNHKQKYPHHRIIKQKIKENKNNEEENKSEKIKNCISCRKRIIINEKIDKSYCENCEGNLCKNCIIRHKDYYPNHVISNSLLAKIEKEKNNLNEMMKIQIKYCHQCKRQINNNIKYCFRCNVYFCDKCSKSHNLKLPNHKITTEKQNMNNELYPKMKTNENEEINSNNPPTEKSKSFIESNKDENKNKNKLKKRNSMNYDYYNDNIKQKIKREKEKGKKENNYLDLNKCKVCGKYKNNQIKCEICKLELCKNCFELHLRKFPSHDISSKNISNKENVDDEKENKRENKNLRKNKNICINCRKNMNLKNNETIFFCEKCKGNICKNCKIAHITKYPKHNPIISRIYFFDNFNSDLIARELKCLICKEDLLDKIEEPISTCFKCNGSLCKDCSRSHISEFVGHKLHYNLFIPLKNNEELVGKNLQNNQNQNNCLICQKAVNFKENEDNNYCIICDGIICENCIKIHFKQNDNHTTIPITIIKKSNSTISSNLQNKNCVLCKTDISNNIKDSIIFNCYQCEGDLCNECANDHLIKKIKHKLSVIKYILHENIHTFNCYQCRKTFKNNNSYKFCENCKIQICFDCADIHKQKYKNHYIIYIKEDNNKIEENYLSNDNSVNIVEKENEKEILNENKGDLIEQCYSCQKNLFSENDSIINHCFDCKCNFCIKCSKNHIKNNNSHDLNLFEVKLLNPKEDLNSCNICNICEEKIQSKRAFYKCENCNIDLCEECIFNHYKSKPNHNFILVKYKNVDEQINDIYDELKYPYHDVMRNQNFENDASENNERTLNISSLRTNEDYCNNCGIKLNDISKQNCNNCKMIFCNECINYHLEKHNEYKLMKSSSQRKIFLSKEEKGKCNKCLKLFNQYSIYKCNKCKIKLCQECSIIHNKIFSSHKLVLLKNFSEQNQKEQKEKEDKSIQCSCLLCETAHYSYPNRFFYVCSECNGNICSLCKKNHDNKFYSHILVFPHKYGEENMINKKHRRYSSFG